MLGTGPARELWLGRTICSPTACAGSYKERQQTDLLDGLADDATEASHNYG